VRIVLQVIGLILILGSVSFWAVGGAEVGWTKTSVAIEKIDPVTELAYQEYQDQFVPGVEFPAVGVVVGLAFIGFSFFLRKHPTQPTQQ